MRKINFNKLRDRVEVIAQYNCVGELLSISAVDLKEILFDLINEVEKLSDEGSELSSAKKR